MSAKRDTRCYDCGCPLTKANRTKDHIPPKCLFPESLRKDLITVGCCAECNNRHSAQDDVLMLLSAHLEAGWTAAPIIHKVAESFAKPHAINLRKAFGEVLRRDISKGGKPDSEMSIPIEGHAVFSRMVKGLLWHLCGIGDAQALTFHVKQAQPHEREFIIQYAKHDAHSLTKGGGVFRVDWITPSKTKDGAWWLQFWGGPIFAVTHHASINSSENLLKCPFCRRLAGK